MLNHESLKRALIEVEGLELNVLGLLLYCQGYDTWHSYHKIQACTYRNLVINLLGKRPLVQINVTDEEIDGVKGQDDPVLLGVHGTAHKVPLLDDDKADEVNLFEGQKQLDPKWKEPEDGQPESNSLKEAFQKAKDDLIVPAVSFIVDNKLVDDDNSYTNPLPTPRSTSSMKKRNIGDTTINNFSICSDTYYAKREDHKEYM